MEQPIISRVLEIWNKVVVSLWVEDVVTTGGTLLKVIERVEALGFTVAMVITIVERQEGGRRGPGCRWISGNSALHA